MSRLVILAAQHQELRRRLLLEDPELDEVTLADTVEGLTDLHEALAAVIRAALFDEALAAGLKDRIAEMEERLRRFDERAGRRRHLVRDIMLDGEIKKITDPEFTISTRAGTASLTVIDETVIPDAFWEPRAPRLNRQGLINELKQGADIPGVQLSNPQPVLSVRVR